ncbi:hypothetical protein Pmani_028144 [Petrolisthes manimaculis]|uniref:Uncharacterized protein n=1 Tax=Petrolisthes manimaculis TaxID=1843537 RepID=A0AAE1TYB7_9EUCA|nr:hypothetical protein Pmani_038573 [Petrolisthes manimaculis]KAK4299585.1 hypothetical protein Pmani_028144 [Petrolisthes manimaculis]
MDVGARARVSHLPATCCKGTPIFTFRTSHGGPETASITSESLPRREEVLYRDGPLTINHRAGTPYND